MMSVEDQDTGIDESQPIELGLAERWIVSRLQQTEREVVEQIENYRFDLAAQAIYEFTWDEYCDWYLELSKVTLTGDSSEAARRGTRRTLVRVLEALLRLAHPIMPYITEELWQRVAPYAGVAMSEEGEATIMLQSYPQADADRIDQSALAAVEWLKSFTLGVRRIRAEFNIAPGKPLPVLISGGSDAERGWLNDYGAYVRSLARIESIGEWTEDMETATALAGDMTIAIPLAGLIDPNAELSRLQKELDKYRNDRQRISAKLENSNFVDKAPAEVVDKERQRCAELDTAITKLEQQYERIQSL